MSTYIVHETIEGQYGPRRRWRLHLPRAFEKNGYRQVTSFNAFFNGMNRYNWKNPKGKYVLYTAHLEAEYHHFWLHPAMPKDQTPVDVFSIWDFYKAIGFDYKSKRYA
jgi:hypothetical protein